MASLSALAKSYKTKKDATTKLRRQSEKKLKEALSQKRRSTSGLVSLERKKEDLTRRREHVAQLMNQYLAQKESIERLKIAAEERLRHEQDARDEARQQTEYGGPEEKAANAQRLKIIDDKIVELQAQIKEREGAERRILNQIQNLQKDKKRLDAKLRNQIHAKPGLVEQLRSSEKWEATLRPRVCSLVKKEEHAAGLFQSAAKKLAMLEAQRRKAARRRAAKIAARRRAAKKAKLRRKKKNASKRARTRTRKAPKRKTARKMRRRPQKRRTVKRRSKARRSSRSKRR